MGVEKCQGCAYLNPKMFHCGKYLRGIETAMYLCPTAKPQTNADRIRSMTDEELAEVIKNPCDTGLHMPNEWCKKRDCGYQCSLDWLKQEAQCTSE